MVGFQHVQTVPLAYNGECGLRAVGPQLDFYAEEIYGDEGWMAQYHYSFEGQQLAAVDEQHGDNQGEERLAMQGSVLRPMTGANFQLNFGGARLRGLQAEDRIADITQALPVPDKLFLADGGYLPGVQPPAILGLSHSYVVSEVRLSAPGEAPPLFLLSRRLGVSFRLAAPAEDAEGLPYDYDTQEFGVLQLYYAGQNHTPLEETILGASALGLVPRWPTDIVVRDDHLFVADSARGQAEVLSRIHIWKIVRKGD